MRVRNTARSLIHTPGHGGVNEACTSKAKAAGSFQQAGSCLQGPQAAACTWRKHPSRSSELSSFAPGYPSAHAWVTGTNRDAHPSQKQPPARLREHPLEARRVNARSRGHQAGGSRWRGGWGPRGEWFAGGVLWIQTETRAMVSRVSEFVNY